MSVRELFDLTGKVALVTGGSRGLGLQIAEALGEMGARVIITARKRAELDEAAAQLRGQGIDVLPLTSDLSQTETIRPMVEELVASYGGIDILVNNAGATWGAPAADHPLDAWQKVLNLNLTGIFVLTQAVGGLSMIPRRSGRIINVASIAGLKGNDPHGGMFTLAYNTTKGGVINMTRALAAEWGPHRITVNAIAPGFFPSKMTRGTLASSLDAIVARNPLGRIGGDEDLKGLAVLLASDASAFITGQIVAVDGGRTCV